MSSIAAFNMTNGSAGNAISLRLNALDDYRLGLGFDDVVNITPAAKQPSVDGLDYFSAVGYDFELNKAPAHEFLGRMYSDYGFLCFFAGGLPKEPAMSGGTAPFRGIADGLVLVGGDDRRLAESGATATMNFATRVLSVQTFLRSRDNPFGGYSTKPFADVGAATAQLTLPAGSAFFTTANLAGPSGSVGSITGAYLSGDAVALQFNLLFANGDRAIGAMVLELDN